jgi:FixJ family two-component response regulator
MIVPPFVVLVEDDPASRKSLARLLRLGGFDALTFGSADEYLASTPREPSVVAMLLDLQLPGTSGLELQRKLRAEGSTLPIIIITAQENPAWRDEAEHLGCVAYLSKPCDGRTILKLLEGLRAASTGSC